MHMNDETKRAHAECVDHWQQIVDGNPNHEPNASQCAFCDRFSAVCANPDTGEICPIRRASGEISCDNTPYSAAYDEWEEESEEVTARQEMLDFLKALPHAESVLPEYEEEL